jgi:hypothetical protein
MSLASKFGNDDGMTDINPKSKQDEGKIAAEHDLQHSAREDRSDEDTVRHGDDDNEEKIVEKHLYKKPETRDRMLKTNPKGKYDEYMMDENN